MEKIVILVWLTLAVGILAVDPTDDHTGAGITITLPVTGGDEAASRELQLAILEKLFNSLNLNEDNNKPGDDVVGSVEFEEIFRCEPGSVLVDNSSCVPCPAGTFLHEQTGECARCPLGQYTTRQAQVACERCGRAATTETIGSTSSEDCKERCPAGHRFDKVAEKCVPCGRGRYQSQEGMFTCRMCPASQTTSTATAESEDECTATTTADRCREMCDDKAVCLLDADQNQARCECRPGYAGDGRPGNCTDICEGRCGNGGACLEDSQGRASCQCSGSYCEEKSEFVHIVHIGGVAGGVVFVVLLVLVVWMICTRTARSGKFKVGHGAEDDFDPNYYGAPVRYAESVAPSHHSTYNPYGDVEDGWDMPIYSYIKDGGLGGPRSTSSFSIYGNKEERLV